MDKRASNRLIFHEIFHLVRKVACDKLPLQFRPLTLIFYERKQVASSWKKKSLFSAKTFDPTRLQPGRLSRAAKFHTSISTCSKTSRDSSGCSSCPMDDGKCLSFSKPERSASASAVHEKLSDRRCRCLHQLTRLNHSTQANCD